jgi:aspartate-semialdehyde dehydrogenase
MLGKRPSPKRASIAKAAIKAADDKLGDRARAAKLWTDTVWKTRTTCSSWDDIDMVLVAAIQEAKKEIITPAIRDEVIDKFTKMRARLTEHNVPELVFCANCTREIGPDDWRKDVSDEIPAFLCEKCAAIPGLE